MSLHVGDKVRLIAHPEIVGTLVEFDHSSYLYVRWDFTAGDSFCGNHTRPDAIEKIPKVKPVFEGVLQHGDRVTVAYDHLAKHAYARPCTFVHSAVDNGWGYKGRIAKVERKDTYSVIFDEDAE